MSPKQPTSSTVSQDSCLPTEDLWDSVLIFHDLLPEHFAAAIGAMNLEGNAFSFLPLLFAAKGQEISRALILMVDRLFHAQSAIPPILHDWLLSEGGGLRLRRVMAWPTLRKSDPASLLINLLCKAGLF